MATDGSMALVGLKWYQMAFDIFLRLSMVCIFLLLLLMAVYRFTWFMKDPWFLLAQDGFTWIVMASNNDLRLLMNLLLNLGSNGYMPS